ncbi:hypothetical protein STEG23_009786 [Scotinomys teguina]
MLGRGRAESGVTSQAQRKQDDKTDLRKAHVGEDVEQGEHSSIADWRGCGAEHTDWKDVEQGHSPLLIGEDVEQNTPPLLIGEDAGAGGHSSIADWRGMWSRDTLIADWRGCGAEDTPPLLIGDGQGTLLMKDVEQRPPPLLIGDMEQGSIADGGCGAGEHSSIADWRDMEQGEHSSIADWRGCGAGTLSIADWSIPPLLNGEDVEQNTPHC